MHLPHQKNRFHFFNLFFSGGEELPMSKVVVVLLLHVLLVVGKKWVFRYFMLGACCISTLAKILSVPFVA
jgi:hypothetical protein